MSVDPSSLIFVVIIGIWALYLVQHWVRRREQVATSRSIDRYSEAMRVLERRAPIPIEQPARSARPYVVASVPATAANVTRPEVAMQPTLTATSRTEERPSARAPRSTTPRRRTHRLRALILLALLVATPAVWAAHIFGTLLLWPTVTVTVLFVADLLIVRSAIRRERAARRRAARMARRAEPVGRAAGHPEPVRRTARPAAPGRRGGVATTFPPTAGRTSTSARAVELQARTVVVAEGVERTGREGIEATAVHSQEAVTEIILREGEWAPVAVPPPTYTMKAKAERTRGDRSPLVADSDSAPTRPSAQPMEPLQAAVEIDEFDLDSVLDRRRAAGE